MLLFSDNSLQLKQRFLVYLPPDTILREEESTQARGAIADGKINCKALHTLTKSMKQGARLPLTTRLLHACTQTQHNVHIMLNMTDRHRQDSIIHKFNSHSEGAQRLQI